MRISSFLTVFLLFFAFNTGVFGQYVWTQKASCSPAGRLCPVGFSINGKGYIGTGWNGTVNLTDMWEYDPAMNTWTQMANFPGTPRYGAAGFALGNFGYVGLGSDAIYPAYTFPLDFWRFDPATNSWAAKATFPGNGRYTISTFAIGAFGYIGTGWDGGYYGDLWRYDPTTDSWLQRANFGGGARQSAVGFAIGTKGYFSSGNNGGNFNDLWEYDPTSNTWTQKAGFTAAARYGASCFVLNGLGFIGTGNGPTILNDLWAYNPVTNTWAVEPVFTGTACYHGIGFSIGCKGYIGTGWTTSFYTPVNEFYEFAPFVHAQFIANPTNQCAGTPVVFTDQSTGADSWSWNFGDGGTSNIPNPTHTYPNAGSYTVTLIVSLANCSFDTTTTTINVINAATAAYTDNSPVCLGQTTTFQNTSIGGTSYAWDFGDGTPLNLTNNPSHVYATPGSFTVTLIAVSGNCSDTVSHTVTITNGAVAGFSYSGIPCSGSTIQFSNSSTAGLSYHWDFGDGDTSNLQTPNHAYNSTGSFTINLVVNSQGCGSDTVQQNIQITNVGTANFSYDIDPCLTGYSFNNLSSSSGSFLWNFGDGHSSTEIAPIHEYQVAGESMVTLIVNPNTGCSDSMTLKVNHDYDPLYSLYIPNCFTPNSDNRNEYFSVVGFSQCTDYHLMIFDRWGEKLFETYDLSQPWDGIYKNEPVQSGTYAYILIGGNKTRLGCITALK